MSEHKVVAVVYTKDGNKYDACYTWETGQTYANEGYRVVAVKDDGWMTKDNAQLMYVGELSRALDCFGPSWRK